MTSKQWNVVIEALKYMKENLYTYAEMKKNGVDSKTAEYYAKVNRNKRDIINSILEEVK